MFQASPTKLRTARKWLGGTGSAIASLVAGLVVVLSAMSAAPASASTTFMPVGGVGHIAVNIANNRPEMIAGGAWLRWKTDSEGYSYAVPQQFFDTAGLTVTASPASSNPQTVTATYYLSSRPGPDTLWSTHQKVQKSATISASEHVNLRGHLFVQAPIAARDYRVVYFVQWTDNVTGANLGSVWVHPEPVNTYCRTSGNCTVTDSWIRV